jgi:hypothetical protein
VDLYCYTVDTCVSHVKLYSQNERRTVGALSRWTAANKAGVSYFLFIFFIIILSRFHNKLSTYDRERKKNNPLGSSMLFNTTPGKRLHSIHKARYPQARACAPLQAHAHTHVFTLTKEYVCSFKACFQKPTLSGGRVYSHIQLLLWKYAASQVTLGGTVTSTDTFQWLRRTD